MTQNPPSPATVSSDVFVSYASKDVAVADAIVETLERNGFKCWMAPRDVTPGSLYADEIVGAINDAKVVVLVLSEHAIASPHVGKEVERASSKRRRIIALRTDTAPLTRAFEYFLSESQWIDASGLGMPAALKKLVTAAGQGSETWRANPVSGSSGPPGRSAVSRAGGIATSVGAPEHGHGLPIKIPFLEQLKRRNVGRVAILYIGVCYLILEFFSTFLHVLALPEWTGRTLAALMVVGFPVVLILAWIFEITPQGIKPATEVDISPSSRKLNGRRLDFATIIVLVLALGYFAADKFWLSKRSEAQTARAPIAEVQSAATPSAPLIPEKSIAVLPFTDMSQKKDQEYFSDGLSEDLITALSQIPGLKVIGRTSSFNFRNSSEGSKTIGAKLGVAHLLEGSVRHAGDKVRVSAELINASDGSTQWSERYDRPYKDLFGLQDDLTRAVGGALKAHLMSRENAPVLQTDRPSSGNLEAYDTVLEGKYYLARGTDADTRAAIERFTRATQLDPRYAFAWSSLSRAWTDLGGYHVDLAAAPEAFSKARRAVNTALSLAPDLANAHIARGWLLEMADLDWRGAEAEYHRAFELVPRNGDAAASLASQLAMFGQVDRAVELTQQALATDPLYSRWYGWLSNYFRYLNRLEEAEGAIRTAIDLQPGAVRLHFVLSEIEIRRGNAEAALSAAKQEPLGSVFRDAALAKALQNSNDRTAADAALKNLLDRGASWDPYDVAQIYAMRNDADKTFEWLDRAWNYRDPSIQGLPYDAFIRRFKGDPRFIAYSRKVGLPVLENEERTVSK